jgi:hypothetical protein
MSDLDLDRRIVTSLRAPVSPKPGARDAIMQRVRIAARHEMPRRRDLAPVSRSVRQSIVGLALAAGIGSVTALSALAPRAMPDKADARSGVIGDTVVATLRDTMRLVRLIFDDPGARHVAVAGDFNRWQSAATPLRREGQSRRWSVVVAMHDGEHRYAFVVDGTRFVPDPTTARVRGDDGRIVSQLRVARVSN